MSFYCQVVMFVRSMSSQCYVITCHDRSMSSHLMSLHVQLCRIMSCLFFSCLLILSHYVSSCVMSCSFVLCLLMSSHCMSSRLMSCSFVLCLLTCQVVSCHLTSSGAAFVASGATFGIWKTLTLFFNDWSSEWGEEPGRVRSQGRSGTIDG